MIWLRRTIAIVLACAALAFIASTAWMGLHNNYRHYDDEGYVAFTVDQFRNGLRLYDDVFSQYGPFPFVAADTVFDAAGAAITTNNIRFATWIGIVLTLAAVGTLAGRLTRAMWVPALVILAGVDLLRSSFAEPFHPGHAVAVVLATGALGVVWAWDREWRGIAAAIAGAVAAALVLTKVNVGILWILAAGTVAVYALRMPDFLRWTWLVALGASPWILMASGLERPAVFLFALWSSMGLVALGLAMRRQVTAGDVEWRCVAAGVLAFLAVAAGVVAVVLAHGTTPGALAHAVLVQPLGQTTAWAFDLPWRIEIAVPWLVGPAALAAVLGWGGRGPAVVRVLVGVALPMTALLADWWVALQVALFAGVLAVGAGGRGLTGRVWLASFAQLQVLHAYPVAGSQVGWGALLALPLAGVLVLDGLERVGTPRSRAALWVVRGLGPALLALGIVAAWDRRSVEQFWYEAGRPLPLPGADAVRLPDVDRAFWSVLVANLQGADKLLSMPGMGCLHLWSGVPPAAPPLATQWWSLLPEDRQDELRRGLAAAERPVVVIHRTHLEFLEDNGFGPRGGLALELQDAWACHASFNGVELRSRPGEEPEVVQLLRWDGVGWVVRLPAGGARRLVGVGIITRQFSGIAMERRGLNAPFVEIEADGEWVRMELPCEANGVVALRLPADAVPAGVEPGGILAHLEFDDGVVIPAFVDGQRLRP